MKLEDTLQKAGMTDGESRVYLALLALGSTSVGPLIKDAKISGSKVYVILDKLAEKGLVSYILKNGVKYFQASPPDEILNYMHKQSSEIEAITKELSEHLPQLKAMQDAKPLEEARIYKGLKAIREAFRYALDNKELEKYKYFSVGYSVEAPIAAIFNFVGEQLMKRKIPIKGLAHKSEKEHYEKNIIPKYNYQMKYTDIHWPADIGIIGNKVLILIYRDVNPTLFLLESKALASSFDLFFDALWNADI